MTSSAAKSKAEKGNTAVPHQGDHDRVEMLSLKADGTPDQHNPELIGDPEATLAATKEQFAQQSVSAADVAANVDAEVDETPQDPNIAAAQAEHAELTEKAHAAAEAVVEGLSSDASASAGKTA